MDPATPVGNGRAAMPRPRLGYGAPLAAGPLCSRSLAISLVGAHPKKRLYSRLNCDALR